MSQLTMVNENIRRASAILDLGERVEKLLLTPDREVKVEIAVELDNGDVATYSDGHDDDHECCDHDDATRRGGRRGRRR